jgi:hypothetical protein
LRPVSWALATKSGVDFFAVARLAAGFFVATDLRFATGLLFATGLRLAAGLRVAFVAVFFY